MGTREAMIAQAEKALGTAGRPNYLTRWYANRNGSYFASAPWCNMAITYWAYHSGNYNEVCHGTDYAYTVWHAQRFQKAGEWHYDVHGIRRGDIVFFDWAGTNSIGRIDHIGIVTNVDGSRIHTIEGNTSDRCARRVRYASQIVGYGRPQYEAQEAPEEDGAEVYVVQRGDSLWSISVAHDCTVADLRRWNPGIDDLIHPGDELFVAAEADKPYSPPPFPDGLRPDDDSPSARGLQKALKAAGYMADWVALADNYGPQTQAAVIEFHRENPEYAARYTDPVIGPRGWAHLHREAYGD